MRSDIIQSEVLCGGRYLGFFVLGQRVTLRGKVFRDPRYLAEQNVFWKKYFAMQGIFISTGRGAAGAPPTSRQKGDTSESEVSCPPIIGSC